MLSPRLTRPSTGRREVQAERSVYRCQGRRGGGNCSDPGWLKHDVEGQGYRSSAVSRATLQGPMPLVGVTWGHASHLPSTAHHPLEQIQSSFSILPTKYQDFNPTAHWPHWGPASIIYEARRSQVPFSLAGGYFYTDRSHDLFKPPELHVGLLQKYPKNVKVVNLSASKEKEQTAKCIFIQFILGGIKVIWPHLPRNTPGFGQRRQS